MDHFYLLHKDLNSIIINLLFFFSLLVFCKLALPQLLKQSAARQLTDNISIWLPVDNELLTGFVLVNSHPLKYGANKCRMNQSY